jgi:hypothetical protein
MKATKRLLPFILAAGSLFAARAPAIKHDPWDFDPKIVHGSPAGPARDDIVPGEFFVDPPTLENMGFRCHVEGDRHRNATVAVSYRSKGESAWPEAPLILPIGHEIVTRFTLTRGIRPGETLRHISQHYRTGNLFAGSVLFLEPGATYEVRFTMSDPDGGAPREPKVVTIATRAEPVASSQGRTLHVYPGGTKPADEFKWNNHPTGAVAYHNTLVSGRVGFRTPLWSNAHLRKNLFLGNDAMISSGTFTPELTTLDYNGYHGKDIIWARDREEPRRYATLAESSAATGLERHGRMMSFDVFVRASPVRDGMTYQTSDFDQRLQTASNAIDADVRLPNINDDFTGSAPNPGALEHGRPRRTTVRASRHKSPGAIVELGNSKCYTLVVWFHSNFAPRCRSSAS